MIILNHNLSCESERQDNVAACHMKIAAPLSCPVRRVRVTSGSLSSGYVVWKFAEIISEAISLRRYSKINWVLLQKVPRVGKLGWEETAVSIQAWVCLSNSCSLPFLGIQLTPWNRKEPQRLEGVRVFCSILQLVRKLSFVLSLALAL